MTTLDTVVTQRLREFDALITTQDACRQHVKTLEHQLGDMVYEKDPIEYSKRLSQLDEARRDLQKAEGAENEKMDYLLKAIPYIREYAENEPGVELSSPLSVTPKPVPGQRMDIEHFVHTTATTNRSDIFNRYLEDVEHVMVTGRQGTIPVEDECCAECNERIYFDQRTSALVCTGCGLSRQHIEGSVRNLTYEEEVTQGSRSQFSYKRLNHLSEWLSALQALENTHIPDEVIDAVKNEFRKHRMTSRGDITPARVKGFLKKLGMSKWYEHTNHITNMINGVPAPRLPQDLEDMLKKMFLQIQAPFEKHCPRDRKNFLSYGYTLYQMCRLLGEDEYLPLFPLLKSKDKLHAQDKIWKNICAELQWEYLPTT